MVTEVATAAVTEVATAAAAAATVVDGASPWFTPILLKAGAVDTVVVVTEDMVVVVTEDTVAVVTEDTVAVVTEDTVAVVMEDMAVDTVVPTLVLAAAAAAAGLTATPGPDPGKLRQAYTFSETLLIINFNLIDIFLSAPGNCRILGNAKVIHKTCHYFKLYLYL